MCATPQTISKDVTFAFVMEWLKAYGLLLQTDQRLPNVGTLVTGETLRGSWWAHPRSHDIFRVIMKLATHADVMILKLVNEKVTFIERTLWPAIVAVGCARASWQMAHLSSNARELLKRVGQSPVETESSNSKAASELEKALLVYSQQFHTAAGSHARHLESWQHWMDRTKFRARSITAEDAKRRLEEALENLNAEFRARGRLPWQT